MSPVQAHDWISVEEVRYDPVKTKELFDLFDKIGECRRTPIPWLWIIEM